MVAVNAAVRRMPSRLTVLNPGSVKVTTYSPGLRSMIWNCPLVSVTVEREPSMSTGLAAVTVTPGSMAPDASRAAPEMPLPI